MPNDTSNESSRRDLSKTAFFGIGTLLVVEQSSLESQSRGCATTPILEVFRCTWKVPHTDEASAINKQVDSSSSSSTKCTL